MACTTGYKKWESASLRLRHRGQGEYQATPGTKRPREGASRRVERQGEAKKVSHAAGWLLEVGYQVPVFARRVCLRSRARSWQWGSAPPGRKIGRV